LKDKTADRQKQGISLGVFLLEKEKYLRKNQHNNKKASKENEGIDYAGECHTPIITVPTSSKRA
jgi:hypothetical protein